MIFGREPARWIGLIVALILGVITTLAGDGLISDTIVGKATDIVNSLAGLLVLLAPIIAAEGIRQVVTPTAKPQLEIGTPVTTKAGAPGVVTADPRIRG